MTKTTIEWADEVWNPVTGCTKVSQGCKNCYAERVAERFWGERKFTDVRMHPERLEDPLHWKKPRRVFVNSMSDLFHPDVPFDFIDRVFAVMALCPQHTFLVLTKRPERMVAWFRDISSTTRSTWVWSEMGRLLNANKVRYPEWPLPNVWMGVSVEDQKAADERIPLLLQTPAAVRFISAEPLLGPVDLRRGIYSTSPDGESRGTSVEGLNWVICGGESGSNARPMHPDWVRGLRDQCQAAGVPFFFKQWGEWAPDCLCDTKEAHKTIDRPQPGHIGCMFRCGKKAAGRLLDGHEWNEYPGGE
ncbi:MAG TPA: phage Gp37/Gp68 family protein [Bellilinea sp.]|nr:phage Gp37/Gp68 family protein [Bellilinea sp.]